MHTKRNFMGVQTHAKEIDSGMYSKLSGWLYILNPIIGNTHVLKIGVKFITKVAWISYSSFG